jgi:hypothetical protein
MNDTAIIRSVAELMVEEKVLTEFGLKILHNDIDNDMNTMSPQDPQKITRVAIYFTIVYNMALLFSGYCLEKGEDPREERLREIGVMVVEYIPKLLRGLDDKYLEVYHGAKVKAFEHGQRFDDYFPAHPDEQKLIDKMNNKVKDEEFVQTI